MTPKLQACGKSFFGLATYLTHDPKAKTEDRIDWTHTLNLAHDHVPSAVDEMLWTARQAELLKQEAGIRAGGRSTENTVKHFSLNWSPEDNPTREHMIETAESFLKHMKWNEHQALLVAHNDKPYAHVHIMLNVIHPETGLKLNEDFEHRRAQAWALGYEQDQGRVYCTQRLKDEAEREDAPTRPAWMAFQGQQREFENAEKMRRDQEPILVPDMDMPENPRAAEWKTLKQIQRDERTSFFGEVKLVFSELRQSIYGEVREEFREKWADYFSALKAREDGDEPADLSARKAELVAEQKKVLEERRDEACKQLLESRKEDYQDLLAGQRDARAVLRWRQQAGLDNTLFLEATEDGRHNQDAGPDISDGFRTSAQEVLQPGQDRPGPSHATDTEPPSAHHSAGLKSETTIGANVGISFGLGLIDILGGIADGLVWSKPDPKPAPVPDKAERYQDDLFRIAADQGRERARTEQEDEEREWRLKQRGAGE